MSREVNYDPSAIYSAPELYEEASDGRRLKWVHGTQLTVGSDLVLTTGKDTETKAWHIDAFDSDGNWLACLATHKAEEPPDSTMFSLAVSAAVRLFPNHLLTSQYPKEKA